MLVKRCLLQDLPRRPLGLVGSRALLTLLLSAGGPLALRGLVHGPFDFLPQLAYTAEPLLRRSGCLATRVLTLPLRIETRW